MSNPQYHFTVDWFSKNIPTLEKYLAPFKGNPTNFLEIGCYEGKSTIWFLENILTKKDVEGLYDRFIHNISVSGQEAKLLVRDARSEDVLPNLTEKAYDVIYIDGSHFSSDVIMDGLFSWLALKPGGYMIFDDYEWDGFENKILNPKYGIDVLLKFHKGRYKEIHKDWQVIIQKL